MSLYRFGECDLIDLLYNVHVYVGLRFVLKLSFFILQETGLYDDCRYNAKHGSRYYHCNQSTIKYILNKRIGWGIIMSEQENKVFTGLADVYSQNVFFRYENGNLKLIFPNDFNLNMCTNDVSQIMGVLPETKQNIVFYLSTPLSLEHYGDAIAFFGSAINCTVAFFIENARIDQKCIQPATKMIFRFDELDHFVPSCNLLEYNNTTHQAAFDRYSEVKKFDITISGHDVKLILSLNLFWYMTSVSNAETHSHITFEFSETSDTDFLMDLYYIIYELFCFIYNRRNISLKGAYLLPEKYNATLDKNPMLCVIDHFRQEQDTKKRINHPCLCNLFLDSFEDLLQLFIDGKQITDSIHLSSKYANLIDKRLYLPISSAFEYLFRSSSGFNSQINHGNLDSCELAVKIRKVYDDSDGYTGLNRILSEWFGKDIKILAQVANDWRNEYAHEKRANTPSLDVIKSARLLEHINYAMILRQAGYSDDCIKEILSTVLYRW